MNFLWRCWCLGCWVLIDLMFDWLVVKYDLLDWHLWVVYMLGLLGCVVCCLFSGNYFGLSCLLLT